MVNASRHIDMDKLVFASKPIQTRTAVEEDIPFEWDDDVLNGNRKVMLSPSI